jgi:hypothetical protein
MIAKTFFLAKDFNRIGVRIIRDHGADSRAATQPRDQRDLRG